MNRLRVCALLLAFLAVCLAWSYWPTFADIVERWSSDPSYSHGFLVPLFAAYLLWVRRARFEKDRLQPSVYGLGLLGVALGLRLAGTYYHFGWFDQLSLVPCLAGVVWTMCGRQTLVWAAPALAFLFFMIPLPHSLAHALSGPMQTFATVSSTFFLQVLGRPALAEGNIILLNDVELGIVEACSGLRMLMVFFALSTGVALLLKKPLWERLLVAASAIPIALVTNILRITVTGLLHDTVGSEMANAVFHDLAGWLMMPVGLAFLGLELLLLKKLLIEPGPSAPALVQVTQQRVGANPLSLYGRPSAPRRSKSPAVMEPVQTASPASPVGQDAEKVALETASK
ncbi:MAG: exosortase/archaeosortase family protein [Gemmataceae bacterium]